jgi:hypothetical protein
VNVRQSLHDLYASGRVASARVEISESGTGGAVASLRSAFALWCRDRLLSPASRLGSDRRPGLLSRATKFAPVESAGTGRRFSRLRSNETRTKSKPICATAAITTRLSSTRKSRTHRMPPGLVVGLFIRLRRTSSPRGQLHYRDQRFRSEPWCELR